MFPRSGRHAVLAGKVVVSGILLATLFWRVDRAAFVRSLTFIPLPLFLGCVFLYALSYTLSALRWHCLVRATDIRISFGRLWLIFYEAAFFNLFLPTLIGGDIIRGVLIYRASDAHDASLPSILLDRVSGFAAMLLIALTALGLNYSRIGDPQIVALLLMVTVLFVFALILFLTASAQRVLFGLVTRTGLTRLETKLQGITAALRQYRQHSWALAQAFGISLVLQALQIVIFSFIGGGLHLSVSLADYFVFVPLVNVVAMLPVSIAGLGVRESGVVYFFAKAGVDAAAALGMSLIWFSLTLIVCGTGGLIFLLDQHLLKRTPA